MKKGQCIGRGRTAEVFQWGDTEILKLFNEGMSAGNEANNARIIYELGIPSPAVSGIIEVDGRQGIIYEKVEGPTMLKCIEPDPSCLSKYAKLLAELQTAIHQVKVEYPPNLKQQLRRNIAHLNKLGEERKNRIIERLNELPEGNVVCHYDFHPDNIIISKKGPIIIDWANVLVGNPHADVSRTSIMLKSNALPPGPCPSWLKDRTGRLYFYQEYLEAYIKLNSCSLEEIALWELPTSAARLREGISEEEGLLMERIESLL